jgi:hypothetical protein
VVAQWELNAKTWRSGAATKNGERNTLTQRRKGRGGTQRKAGRQNHVWQNDGKKGVGAFGQKMLLKMRDSYE